MQKHSKTGDSGLPWPDAYLGLLPAIREEWGTKGDIYLSRSLSGGKSGALVYAADIDCSQFTGQAILKLDEARDPVWQEEHEADLHRRAIAEAPDFAAAHLPRLIHSLHRGNQIAFLSTIAGRGLEYAEPWPNCPFDRQMAVVHQLSRGLLEDWNRDYKLSSGLHIPPDLLERWLDYRLVPAEGGRIHQLLTDDCGLSPEEPSITFDGRWYPNPLAFALTARELPDRLRLRAITGHCHGDLHGLNLLVGRSTPSTPSHYLIDLAMYQSEQFLLFDHAYFEVAYLLTSRETATPADWASILHQLSYFHSREEQVGLRTDDLGLFELVRALRQEVNDWIDRHESDRLSYMESQYLLARVAAGLNFSHKNISKVSRRMAFIYAASNLKDYLKLNQVDWPKYGPPFVLESRAPAVERPEASAAAAARPEVSAPAAAPAAAPGAARATSAPANGGAEDSLPLAPADGATGRGPVATFIGELRRRQVVKVAGVYMIVSWLCVQVASVLTASLSLPPWTDTLVTVLLALGFPIACVIAWAFELSPNGLQRTRPAARGDPGPLRGGGVLDYVVAAGVIAILAFSVGRQALDYFAADSPMASRPDGLKSIAVLPFKNLSPDGDDNFSDGLTIEILSTLAQTGQFRIPGRSSSFRYKDQPDDLRAIGRALGVEYILEGSVRRSGDDLRIEAQLVQADDGFLVWSDVFVDEVKDIFVVQEKIANAIGAALKTPLGIEAATLQTERTDNPEAYDLFLNALGLIGARGPGLEQAVELLERSVEIEPDFAAGWGALSLAYDLLPIYVQEVDGRPVTPARYYRKALASALQAAKLDSGLPIVQHATGNVHRRNRLWVSAENNYRRALAQEPNDHAVMKDYSSLLAIVGHHEQAVAMAEQMRAQDPLNPLYEYLQALYLWQAEHDEESIERLVEYFEDYRIFDEVISRTLIGYMVATEQIDRLKQILSDCPTCDQPWRERALAMIDAVGTESPGSIFDAYKDEMFVSYHFWDSVGGPDLVLEAFEYNGLKTDRRLQLFTVPWSLIGAIGDTDEFKQLADDMGLVAYWGERGWPDRCKPLEGDDFECR